MTVLLTGGAGYIGSHVAVEFLQSGYDVIIADNFYNSSQEVPERIRKITGKSVRTYYVDIQNSADLEQIFKRHEINAVMHFAGYKAVGESVQQPLKYYRDIDKAGWYRHEGFFPVIIGKQEWEQVQRLLKQQARPANSNQAKHRYAGLLTCRECGNTFIPMIRCWNGKSRVEYVCLGYHRNGKTYCASHRIHEEVLDAAVQEYTETVRKQCAVELKKLAQLQKMWALRKPVLDAHILSLQGRIQGLEQEIDEIVMQKLSKYKS